MLISSVRYRPEIDGLRAIAVLAVLIYHAGFTFLPGGFMGVDIFFVISGFLITSFIVSDINDGTFSMLGFWERRARRILPPLFAVIAATAAATWFLFIPFDYIQLGKEMASQAAFGSNILFMAQGGYFDSGEEAKALLHTWSLAVEEQFYLFFPIGMALFARFISRKFFYLLLPAVILTFVLCIVAVGISDRVAFYGLPFRGWELLAGAIVAVSQAPTRFKAWQREGISIIGLAMIVAALTFYHPPIPFPGYIGLLPVVGTALIIWANGAGITRVGEILAIKPMVAVGLISYSLYLWHWPILIIVRYIPTIEFTSWIGGACMIASGVLAALTWYFIEQPVRRKQVLPTRKSIFLFSLSGLLIIAITGAAIIAGKGFPARFDDAVMAYANGKYDENPHRADCNQIAPEKIIAGDVCQTNAEAGKPSFILWGDSMADAMTPAFYDISKETKLNGFVVTKQGCPPILGGNTANPLHPDSCRQNNDAVFELIKAKKIDRVFLAGNWSNYLHVGQMIFEQGQWQEGAENFGGNIAMSGLQGTIKRLKDSGADVIILYDTPLMPVDPPKALALAQRFGNNPENLSLPMLDYEESINNGIGLFRDLTEQKNVHYIELGAFLCDEHYCPMGKDGKSLYFNPGHLSTYGARQLEPAIKPFFY